MIYNEWLSINQLPCLLSNKKSKKNFFCQQINYPLKKKKKLIFEHILSIKSRLVLLITFSSVLYSPKNRDNEKILSKKPDYFVTQSLAKKRLNLIPYQIIIFHICVLFWFLCTIKCLRMSQIIYCKSRNASLCFPISAISKQLILSISYTGSCFA